MFLLLLSSSTSCVFLFLLVFWPQSVHLHAGSNWLFFLHFRSHICIFHVRHVFLHFQFFHLSISQKRAIRAVVQTTMFYGANPIVASKKFVITKITSTKTEGHTRIWTDPLCFSKIEPIGALQANTTNSRSEPVRSGPARKVVSIMRRPQNAFKM